MPRLLSVTFEAPRGAHRHLSRRCAARRAVFHGILEFKGANCLSLGTPHSQGTGGSAPVLRGVAPISACSGLPHCPVPWHAHGTRLEGRPCLPQREGATASTR